MEERKSSKSKYRDRHVILGEQFKINQTGYVNWQDIMPGES